MPAMKRGQELQLVPGADTAILFIHGILGTPDQFRPFLQLVPSNWTLCNILLKGHCGSVRDFSSASMAEWKRQVHETLRELQLSHDRVIIAAHSMGALFAIQEAVEVPVEELFLLNAPLRVHLTVRLLKIVWGVFRGNISPDDDWMLAAQNAYGVERDSHILRYLSWIPRYVELFSEIRKTRKIAPELTVKSRLYYSARDEMVSIGFGGMFENNACVTVKALDSSGHVYYSPEDLRFLQNEFGDMVQRYRDEPA